MSFFKEIVTEFKNELEKAKSELGVDAKSFNPSNQNSTGSNPQVAPFNQSQGRQANTANTQRRKSSGKSRQRRETAESVSTDESTGTTVAPRPSATSQSTARASSSVHSAVAGLNPQTARNAIIMAEVLGQPVSKRQRKRAY